MDIVTHGCMGVVLASAGAEAAPLSAAAFAFGNVAPDLDAVSRCWGKKAFLAVHQSHTHSYAAAAICGLALDLGLRFGAPAWHEPWAGLALFLGMALHATLDASNTYGITLWAPISAKRTASEWVFFIDAVVIALTALACAGVALHHDVTGSLGWSVQAGYAASLLGYWGLKGWLRARAGRLAPPDTVSLLPSALVPWAFWGVARTGERARLFRLDARDGSLAHEERVALLDADFEGALAHVREFQVMRALSPAYHVVACTLVAEGERLLCRDLRTRNFSTRFGELELTLTPAREVQELVFHV